VYLQIKTTGSRHRPTPPPKINISPFFARTSFNFSPQPKRNTNKYEEEEGKYTENNCGKLAVKLSHVFTYSIFLAKWQCT
jgi:hypothetical protein